MIDRWHSFLGDWANEFMDIAGEAGAGANLRLGLDIGPSLLGLAPDTIRGMCPTEISDELVSFYLSTNGLMIPGFGRLLPLGELNLYSRLYPKQYENWVRESGVIWYEDHKIGVRKRGNCREILGSAIALSDDLASQSIVALFEPNEGRYWIFDFHQPEADQFCSAYDLISHLRWRSSRNVRCMYGLEY